MIPLQEVYNACFVSYGVDSEIPFCSDNLTPKYNSKLVAINASEYRDTTRAYCGLV